MKDAKKNIVNISLVKSKDLSSQIHNENVIASLPALTSQLLNVIAINENIDLVTIYKKIMDHKKPTLDDISAIKIFILCYINETLKDQP